MDEYDPPPVDYLAPIWPPTRVAGATWTGAVDWKDAVPIGIRGLWASRPTAERAEMAASFAAVARTFNDLAPLDSNVHSPGMDKDELDTQLDMTADLITRLVDAKPDDPGLLSTVAALQVALEEKAGPGLVDHVRERFQCLLGSLGLIPSDNEGEPCE
jgi:hypothetical protein